MNEKAGENAPAFLLCKAKNLVDVLPQLGVSTLDGTNSIKPLHGNLPLVAQLLVQDGGRDYVELPLPEIRRISF